MAMKRLSQGSQCSSACRGQADIQSILAQCCSDSGTASAWPKMRAVDPERTSGIIFKGAGNFDREFTPLALRAFETYLPTHEFYQVL